MNILLKEFLTFEEVGKYLEQHGFSYNEQIEEDYYKLKTFILDLYNEKKLNPVFHYNGLSHVSVVDAYEDEDEDAYEDEDEDEDEIVLSAHYKSENGYFFIHDRQFYDLLNNAKIPIDENMCLQNYVRFKKHPIYNIDEEKEVTFKTVHLHEPSEQKTLDIHGLRYPKVDLDKLFRPATQISSSKINNDNRFKELVLKKEHLGEHQKLLITYALFTPRQIACLLTDYNPAYNHNDDFYNARLDMVENAVQVDTLIPINNGEQIIAKKVKEWLAHHNFIFEGFNDDLHIDIDNLAIDYLNRIAELEQEIEDAKNTGGFSIGTPTVAHDEPKTNEQLVNELAAANHQIAKLKSQLEQYTTDKRSYTTPAMKIMNKVITEFWLDYNPNQSAPKQEIIVRWITGNFNDVSKALALNIDKVCRHSEARSGGKYKR